MLGALQQDVTACLVKFVLIIILAISIYTISKDLHTSELELGTPCGTPWYATNCMDSLRSDSQYAEAQ